MALKMISDGLRRLGIKTGKNSSYTENELRTIVDVSHEEGVIESEERQMINNVFDFGDSLAKDVMTPRADIAFAHVDFTYDELVQLYREHLYTRFPVYDESIDNVIGIINVKDLLLLDSDKSNFNIRSIMREAYFTYEFKKISELLLEMKRDSCSLAIVLDEYGIATGLVSMEDLIEEIVGEIRDEYDEHEEHAIRQINEREYLVEGSLKLDDINDALNLTLESEDYDSIGGIIIDLLEDIPKEGDKVTTDNQITLVVEQMDNQRIDTVHIYLPEATGADEPEAIS